MSCNNNLLFLFSYFFTFNNKSNSLSTEFIKPHSGIKSPLAIIIPSLYLIISLKLSTPKLVSIFDNNFILFKSPLISHIYFLI